MKTLFNLSLSFCVTDYLVKIVTNWELKLIQLTLEQIFNR